MPAITEEWRKKKEMSNYITIELCAEDRARLDRLAEALERRTCDKCVTSAIDYLKNAPESHTEEVTVEQETPIVEGTVQAEPTKTVDRADLRAKVIELSAKGFKEQTRDIVRAYAQTVTAVPEDKVAECFAKLEALECKG